MNEQRQLTPASRPGLRVSVLLEARLGGHPLVRQLRFELEELELRPPA